MVELFTVGVFQDATAPYIARCARSIPLDYVQLHGNESIDFVRALQSFRVIKSVRIEQLAEWVQVDLPNLEAILVDSSKGGSGVEQDWDVLSDQLRKLEPVTPILVAGGLKAENVADVVKKIRPFAVDVASGVESEPGVKSPERVESFVRAVGLTYQD